jgi:hypothetical protein
MSENRNKASSETTTDHASGKKRVGEEYPGYPSLDGSSPPPPGWEDVLVSTVTGEAEGLPSFRAIILVRQRQTADHQNHIDEEH